MPRTGAIGGVQDEPIGGFGGSAAVMQDVIGDRGEALGFLALTERYGRKEPYFRPYYLGQKFPTVDFIVELINPGRGKPFFFVQVKTTSLGYTTARTGRRLRVHVSQEDV